MKRIACLVALLSLPAGLWAQESGFSVDANFLTRGEIRDGGLVPLTDDYTPDHACFILERTLLGLHFDYKGLSTRLTAQHAGTWGSSEGGYFNVYEAWAKLETPIGLYAQIGRQNLSYDDERIFGADDWAMTARSHDALRLAYEGHGHKVHLIGAFNQNIENMNGGTYYYGGLQPYKSLQALWYHYDIPKIHLGASALFVNVGMQGGDPNEDNEKTWHQQMAGLYLSFRPKKWNVEASYYHQMGHEEHGIPINAWMASFKGSFTPGTRWSFRSGYDYLSGDADFATPPQGMLGVARHETIHGFSSLYGSHHKFYGAMDFFYVSTYYGGFTPGLQNIYVGTSWKPTEPFSINADFHYLATATKLNNAERSLGYEMELSASWKIRKETQLSLGYTFMRGTETMVLLKRATDRRQLHWGWLMLVVTPTFFSTKK